MKVTEITLPHKCATRLWAVEETGLGCIDLMELCCSLPGVVFLDSAQESALGRFSVIGLDPYLVIEERGQLVFENGREVKEGFLPCLQRHLDEASSPNPTGLPLIQGALGYLSYDFGRGLEGVKSVHEGQDFMPEARFCFYDILVIEERKTGMLHVACQGKLQPAQKALQWVCALLEKAGHAACPTKGEHRAPWSSRFDQGAYENAVSQMMEYMAAGDVYVANMTQQLHASCAVAPYDLFRYLHFHNPAPMAAFLQGQGWSVCCASMERFLQVRGGVVETRPIKGTRPRGRNAAEDEANRLELECSEKDRSELMMVVDLERNDLSKVCLPGSVEVTNSFVVEAYATVFHLVTTVVGALEPGKTSLDLLSGAFPGGSITGTPKRRAMEVIDQLEREARGLYTGSIGYVSANGDCDFNIVIRTAVCHDGQCDIGVGGGITYESDTTFEYEETLQKAKAVLEAAALGGAGYDA